MGSLGWGLGVDWNDLKQHWNGNKHWIGTCIWIVETSPIFEFVILRGVCDTLFS